MCTYSMREKVDAVDYKYFQEPNIVPIRLTEDFLEEIRKEIPKLQYERIQIYMEDYGLSRYDATILVKEKEIAEYFESTIENTDPKNAANWINSVILGYLNKNDMSLKDLFITPKMLSELISMVENGKISSKQGKEILYKSIEEKIEPTILVEKMDVSQIADDTEIRKIVIEVLDENENLIEDYRKGKRVFDFFIGQIMKKTKGKANPSMASAILKEEIEKR